MKIPFDIKYRYQIESGVYKVILDCGIEAEILAWDKPGEYPIVCMAKKEGAIPFRTNNNGKAYHFPEGANYSDLFIVIPEEELTEFENVLDQAMMEVPKLDEYEKWYPFLKEKAAELFALARKEVLKDLPRWYESRGVYNGGWINNGFLYYKNHSIQLSTLEKLPGFNE